MLFTTATFFLLFLPVTLIGFFAFGRWSATAAAAWLFAASLFFYAYWMPAMTLLLVASIAFNFLIGMRIARARRAASRIGRWQAANALLTTGIVVNLALLSYFKYANFFLENLKTLLGTNWHLAEIVLPIGISFYTFTQIAYLVDTWAGKVNESSAVHYGLFVTYFPHLVAGPVLHHAQMMPQFEDRAVYRFNGVNFSAGMAIFVLGLFKKIVLADGISPYADAVFDGADGGSLPTVSEAWLGALAYTAQLYFDFSGYSDMAIGLSRMFNITLPFNFDSPYKARSISDFWRRWHISLSTFLRDYLYFPLGGNRKGTVLRYVNLALTMVLGGLWHGASWSFVIWGSAHGAYLMVNHGFRALCDRAGWSRALGASRLFGWLSLVLTFVAVVIAWVPFRAHTLSGATLVLQAMAGLGGESTEGAVLLWNQGLKPTAGALWCAVLLSVALFAPNSNRIGLRLQAVAASATRQRVALCTLALLLALFLVLVNAVRTSASAFIYFNF